MKEHSQHRICQTKKEKKIKEIIHFTIENLQRKGKERRISAKGKAKKDEEKRIRE